MSVDCTYTWPVAATNGWTISNPIVPIANVSFPTSAPVLSTSFKQIAANWPTLWSSGAARSLISAGVTPYSLSFWSGLNGDGSTSANTCDFWSSYLPTSVNVGASSVTGTSWIDDGTEPCDANVIYALCACISPLVPPTSSPSRSPSRSPSKSPSKSPVVPTTASPTYAADSLTTILYQTSAQFTGSQIGNRNQSNYLCLSDPNFVGLQCDSQYVWSLVGYSTESSYAQPVIPGIGATFSGSKPIFSPDGHELAANWSQLWQFGMLVPGASADLDRRNIPQRANVWSGVMAVQLNSPGNGVPGASWQTCLDWTTSSPIQQGIVGRTEYTTYQWYNTPFGAEVDTCSSTHPMFCACQSTVPATFSPTPPPSPTTPPTQPTQWPSFSPTRSPTHHPSAAPHPPTHAPTTYTVSVYVDGCLALNYRQTYVLGVCEYAEDEYQSAILESTGGGGFYFQWSSIPLCSPPPEYTCTVSGLGVCTLCSDSETSIIITAP